MSATDRPASARAAEGPRPSREGDDAGPRATTAPPRADDPTRRRLPPPRGLLAPAPGTAGARASPTRDADDACDHRDDHDGDDDQDRPRDDRSARRDRGRSRTQIPAFARPRASRPSERSGSRSCLQDQVEPAEPSCVVHPVCASDRCLSASLFGLRYPYMHRIARKIWSIFGVPRADRRP